MFFLSDSESFLIRFGIRIPVEVESQLGKGTTIKMQKEIGKGRELWSTQSL